MGYINTIVESFNAAWRNERGQRGAPIRLTTRAWYNPNLETRWHMIPALIGTLTFVQTLMLTGLSVAREREQGTFDQLLGDAVSGPLRSWPARHCRRCSSASFRRRLVLLVAQLWFRIPFAGSFITLYAGLSVFLARRGRHWPAYCPRWRPPCSRRCCLSFLLIMPFSLLSGLTTPVSSMPEFLQYVTLINPLRYAIDIAHRVYLEGVGFGLLIPRIVAAGRDRLGHVSRRVLDVSPPARVSAVETILTTHEKEPRSYEMNSQCQKFNKAGAVLLLCAAGCAVGPDYQRPDPGGCRRLGKKRSKRGVDTRPRHGPMVDGLQRSNCSIPSSSARSIQSRSAHRRSADSRRARRCSLHRRRSLADARRVGLLQPHPQQRKCFGSWGASAPQGRRHISNKICSGTVSTPIGKSMYSAARGGASKRAKRTSSFAIEDRRDVLVTLLGDVAKNYIDLRGLQRRLAVAQANLKAQRGYLGADQGPFRRRTGQRFRCRSSRRRSQNHRGADPDAADRFETNCVPIDILLGAQPGALWSELANEAPVPALPPEAHVGMPIDLLRRRPDIRSAERQLAAATAQVGAATADLYPKFSLTGSIGLQSISASDWFTARSRFWSIGPTISWPVFDAGRIRAKIEIRNAQQEQALRSYERSVLNALGDVESALVNYGNEQKRYRSLIEAVASNRRAEQMANDFYTAGTRALSQCP